MFGNECRGLEFTVAELWVLMDLVTVLDDLGSELIDCGNNTIIGLLLSSKRRAGSEQQNPQNYGRCAKQCTRSEGCQMHGNRPFLCHRGASYERKQVTQLLLARYAKACWLFVRGTSCFA